MSEIPTDTSEAFLDGEEPSMEDILSSIRKIIAEDKSQNISKEFEPAQDLEIVIEKSAELEALVKDASMAVENAEDDRADEDLDLKNFLGDDDLLDDNDLPDNDVKAESLHEGFVEMDAESENSNIEVMAFDENIDLVLNDEVSDTLTSDTLAMSDKETATFDVELDNSETLQDDNSSFADDDLKQLATIYAGFDDMDEDDTPASSTDELVTETVLEDAPSEEDTSSEETSPLPLEEHAILAPTSEAEDIDLVKSLLADLMEDGQGEEAHEAETEDGLEEMAVALELVEQVGAPKDNDISVSVTEPDSQEENEDLSVDGLLDDILFSSAEAGEISAEPEQDDGLLIPELSFDSADVDMDVEPENELVDIAKRIRETSSHGNAAELPDGDDDIIELPTPDIASKFALNAGVDKPAAALDVVDEMAGGRDGLESLTEIIGGEQTADPAYEQEEDPMVKIVKTETLTSEETDKDASQAFASLSSAVREKTQAQESGPPIGDLVQAALKPMLQNWLDENLKAIVERAVAKEVKRIASEK